MIIYTPRYANQYESAMAEEPAYYIRTYPQRRRRVVDPIDSLFSSLMDFPVARPTVSRRTIQRQPKRPVRRVQSSRNIFDSFFNDDFFGSNNLFDSFFPTLRRTDRKEQTEEEPEKIEQENKENEAPVENEATAEEAIVEEPQVYAKVVQQVVTNDEDGNIRTVIKEKVNNNGEIKETEKNIVEDEETGEIKEEEYFVNGEKADKMALESEKTAEELAEDDEWVIREVSSTEGLETKSQ